MSEPIQAHAADISGVTGQVVDTLASCLTLLPVAGVNTASTSRKENMHAY